MNPSAIQNCWKYVCLSVSWSQVCLCVVFVFLLSSAFGHFLSSVSLKLVCFWPLSPPCLCFFICICPRAGIFWKTGKKKLRPVKPSTYALVLALNSAQLYTGDWECFSLVRISVFLHQSQVSMCVSHTGPHAQSLACCTVSDNTTDLILQTCPVFNTTFAPRNKPDTASASH